MSLPAPFSWIFEPFQPLIGYAQHHTTFHFWLVVAILFTGYQLMLIRQVLQANYNRERRQAMFKPLAASRINTGGLGSWARSRPGMASQLFGRGGSQHSGGSDAGNAKLSSEEMFRQAPPDDWS